MVENRSKNSNNWKLLALVVTGILSISLMMNLYVYSEFTNSEIKYNNIIRDLDDISYSIDFLINYGNGSKTWINNSRIPVGFNLFNITLKLTEGNVEADYYPQFESHFIKSVNGVGVNDNPEMQNWAWIAWNFNKESYEWELFDMSSDMVYPVNRDVIAWYFQDTSNYPNYEKPS
jgi:hypothetical protein